MAALTLAKIRRFTERALRDNKLDAKIESIEWLGKRSKERHGSAYFRVARVVLKQDGRRVAKTASIDTTNSFTIR